MKRLVVILATIVVIFTTVPGFAQNETATYWRDPATGMVYEHRIRDNPPPVWGYPDNGINREIARGGRYEAPRWDYLDAQRKALEIEIMRRQLEQMNHPSNTPR